MKILALDLGKDKCVSCLYEAESGEHAFAQVLTSPEGIGELLTKSRPDRVVIEVGCSAGWVADLVRSMGLELQVANPNHAAWRCRKVKSKTDRLDALKLAKLSAVHQLPTVHMPSARTRQWRSLIAYGPTLVSRRTAIKNRVRSILEAQGLKLLKKGKAGWSEKSLVLLRSLAQPIDQAGLDELWRGELFIELEQYAQLAGQIGQLETKLNAIGQSDARVRRLERIPGVGQRLAETVVAILDDPHRFRSGKQVGSYAGLTPRTFQSGSSNRQGSISGEGNRHLRSMLVEVAWLGLRWNPWMRAVYDRVHRGSKSRKKIAIVAVARRLLVRCWAMLRDETGSASGVNRSMFEAGNPVRVLGLKNPSQRMGPAIVIS